MKCILRFITQGIIFFKKSTCVAKKKKVTRLTVIIFNIVYIHLNNSISVYVQIFFVTFRQDDRREKIKVRKRVCRGECQTSHAQFPSFLNLFFFNVLFKVLTISYIVLKFDDVTFKVVAEKGVTEL